MMPEIAHYVLISALMITAVQFCMYWLYQSKLLELALAYNIVKNAAKVQVISVSLSFFCLMYLLVSNDFTVKYVAMNSNTSLPLIYRACATWGAHEGSLLLWALILSVWTWLLFQDSLLKDAQFKLTMGMVLSVIMLGFLAFILFTSNPFIRLLPIPPLQGRDLNPILQDPGLIIHPPLLYIGYVGLCIPYACAIAALCRGEFTPSMIRWTKHWTVLAWGFLTAGIVLGSWWSYRELGWGGWWFWDPVENASFMPWLLATALIHALVAAQKQSGFQVWAIMLAIMGFILSLLGTFLVRSGVIISIHAFVSNPSRGIYLLLYLVAIIVISLVIYHKNSARFIDTSKAILGSKESLLLLNKIILVTACATIGLGTLYPLVLEIFTGDKISVGPPYFNSVLLPMVMLSCFAMAIVDLLPWLKPAKILHVLKTSLFRISISLLLAFMFSWYFTTAFDYLTITGLTLGFWIMVSLINAKYTSIGMFLAHFGIAVCAIGITMTANHSLHHEVRMQLGESFTLHDYKINFVQLVDSNGENYVSTRATFNLLDKSARLINILNPERRIFTTQQMALSKVAIDANVFRDIYIALGQPIEKNSWSVRIYYKPFIRWIWGGGLLMVLASLYLFFEYLYKNRLSSNKKTGV